MKKKQFSKVFWAKKKWTTKKHCPKKKILPTLEKNKKKLS